MLFLVILIGLVYFASIIIVPFPNLRSFRTAFISTIQAPRISMHQRLNMLRYLVRDLWLLPFWMLFWVADELLFPAYHRQQINRPIFLFSQPRSGTTFLLRSLAEDENSFLSVKHLEWRYPYISFWKLISLLGLREKLEAKSYWPDTEIGKKCENIHHHLLGNYEEFGIFLEERFYHHYFVFRRFPFPEVLERVSEFEQLTEGERRRLLDTLVRVIKKVSFYRGKGEIFLSKENECIDFCRALINEFHDPRVLMICRHSQAMLNSYHTMSINCTAVKHGVDPTMLPGWRKANMDFRREQCRRFMQFAEDLKRTSIKSVLVSFDELTENIPHTIERIYEELEIPLSPAFHSYLQRLQLHQGKRDKGYVNLECKEPGFDFYDEFVSATTLLAANK